MSYNPLSVIAEYFPFDDFMFTYNLAAGIVVADVGKAMTLDTSASNTMKLAVNNTTVHGRLFSHEDRAQQGGALVGTVERKLRGKLPYTGTAPAVGDFVCGSATPGLVRKLVVGTDTAAQNCLVIAVDATNTTVTVELL